MNHYERLGVVPTATPEEVVAAYRKAALEHHPDRNLDNPKEAAKQFKKVSEAFETLGDPAKRSLYDRKHPGIRRAKQKQAKKDKSKHYKSHEDWVRDQDPNLGNIKDAPPPTRDIWGNLLSVDQKKQWIEDNKIKIGKKNNRQRPRQQKRGGGFVDVFAKEYIDSDAPNLR